MKNLKNVLFLVMFFATAMIIGQTKVSGTIVDENNQPLPGTSILEKGTTNGTETDFDGKFILNAQSNSGILVISYIGYKSMEVSFSPSKTDIGLVQLFDDTNALDEIIIKGIVDVAKNRETPVAVSTIKAAEIEDKLGSQEFPEILNNTPSVYATKSGGGFGDARIEIRGFSQENIAVLINGVPINDMENSRVYWSNWAGLSDVTTAIQVQRGLGSSKLAISSVGGTINILTKTTDKQEGGSFVSSIGNDGFLKTVASYSTGKKENGFAASFLLSRTTGGGYVTGTEFEGYNYFIGLGWEFNENHDLQFMLTGAPQAHNQRTTSFYNMATLGNYLQYGEKYNYNHGYLNGKEYNWRRNFYHKPITSVNWNWDINQSSSLSTSAYISFGRGGGTGDIGRLPGYKFASSSIYRNPVNGLVMWDDIVKYNQGETVTFSDGNQYTRPNDGGINDAKDNGLTRRASINSHNWFGLLSNYSLELNQNLTLDFGIDLRSYTGIHYRRVDDLLGANGYFDSNNINNPSNQLTATYGSDLSDLINVFKSTNEEEKIDYHNDGKVRWFGAFTQLEYKNDNISGFIQGGLSQQGFKRIDYFNYLNSDPLQETDWQNIMGGNIKGGLNWNINDEQNIFANAGYYSKQPFFDAVFLNYKNDINLDTKNEKIIGLELGYGFQIEKFKANVNLYRTEWRDRFVRIGYENSAGDEGNAQLNGIKQIHFGSEFEFTFDASDKIRFLGTFSYGNWTYKGKITGNAFDENQNQIGIVDLDVNNVKVGNSPQSISRIGIELKPFNSFKIDYNLRYNTRLYSALVIGDDLDGSDATSLNPAIKLPGYSVSDLGVSYRWLLNKDRKNSLKLRINLNNVFDKKYIAESATNYAVRPGEKTYKGISTGNKVFFGFGRTWNASVKYSF